MTSATTPLRPTNRRVTPDLVAVAVGKGCTLLLTSGEYANGVARGKRYRRRQQFSQRQQPKPPAPLPLFKEKNHAV